MTLQKDQRTDVVPILTHIDRFLIQVMVVLSSDVSILI